MKILLAFALALPLSSYALQLNVNVTSCGALGATQCSALENEIRNYKDLPDVSVDKYADGVASANAFAMKGQGTDYSENFDLFMVQASAGGALDGDLNEVQDNPQSADGIGLGGALTVGLNLDVLPVDKIGPVELKKLDLFASLMSYSLDQDSSGNEIKGDLSSFGVFARYRFYDPVDIVPGYMFHWTGIHLHTGIQRSSMDISMRRTLDNETVSSGGASADFTNGLASFDLETTTTSIPVEISTAVRMAYALTLYTGAGFDYTMGSSDIDFSAGGNLSGTGGFTAEVDADESASGKPEATNFRAFGGLQINVPFVRLFAQVNKGLGNDLIGASAGLKVVW